MFGRPKAAASQQEFLDALRIRGISGREATKMIAAWSSQFATGLNPTGNPVQWMQLHHPQTYALLSSLGVQDPDIAWYWGRSDSSRACQLGLHGLDSLALYLRLREAGVDHEAALVRQSQSFPKFIVLPQKRAEIEHALPVELALRIDQFITSRLGFQVPEGQTFVGEIWNLIISGSLPSGKY
jgi:hypothetical protein